VHDCGHFVGVCEGACCGHLKGASDSAPYTRECDPPRHPFHVGKANGLATLDSSLEALDATLVALWVINRQRDSLELLKEFIEAIPRATVHVVRNGYFGDERKFELYNASKLRVSIESRGGRSVTLPDLADRVADDLYTQRLSLDAAAKSLPIGNRAELARWRGEVRKVLTAVGV
jgi:hypothetical protein